MNPEEMIPAEEPVDTQTMEPAVEGAPSPAPEEAAPMPVEEEVPLEETPDEFIASGEARPVGTQEDVDIETEDMIRQGQEEDPANFEHVTVEEQAAYEDFVARALLFISDDRKRGEEIEAPSDTVLKMLNNPKKTVGQVVGFAAANITFMIHNNAKRQKVEYPPDVLFHGADELIAALYIMGNVAEIFDGVPPIKVGKGENTLGEYDFSPAEMKIIEEAKMTAVQEFGSMLEKTGQITAEAMKEAQAFWNDQIKREVESGAVDGEMFDNLDIEAMRANMSQRMNGQSEGKPNGP